VRWRRPTANFWLVNLPHCEARLVISEICNFIYILLTNEEYIASLNPLMELKHRTAVRMDFKIDYMQQGGWDANNRSARQFPPLLWKYVHINQPRVPTLRQMNPFRITQAYFIRVSGILTSTSYVPMSKVNTLKYNIHVNYIKHSKKRKAWHAMHLLRNL